MSKKFKIFFMFLFVFTFLSLCNCAKANTINKISMDILLMITEMRKLQKYGIVK